MAQIEKLGEAGMLGIAKKKDINSGIDMDELPLGALGVWGLLFLMYLPIVGWIVALCTAFRKNGNLNKRSLARATLVNKIILLAVLAMVIGLLATALGGVLSAMNELNSQLSTGMGDARQLLEQVEQWRQTLADILSVLG